MSRYDDPLAKAIYEGRKKTAGGPDWYGPRWPADRKERARLEATGGNAEMDLAIGSAREVRARGLAK